MKQYIILIAALLIAVTTQAQAQQPDATLSIPQVDSAAMNASPSEQTAPQAAAPAGNKKSIELWEQANAAYGSGDYDTAYDGYKRILDRGEYSAALFYNLANSLFKRGELGYAIIYYNRALKLAPADEDIRHNLAYAESMTKDKIEEIPEFFLTTWIHALRSTLSCTAWTILSLLLFAAMLALALFYLLAHRLSTRKAGFYGMAATLLLFVVTSLFAWGERSTILNRNDAVVMDSAVSVKSSPDKSATDLFVLHEGTKVTVSNAIEDWVEVRIADGKKGWIESFRIERI